MASKDKKFKDNPLRLSKDELRVLRVWQKCGSMREAYQKIMDPDKKLKPRTRDTYAKRFFDNARMREAMANTPGPHGAKARANLENWRVSKSYEGIKEIRAEKVREKAIPLTDEDVKEVKSKSAKTLWIESLNINETPVSLTIYGTGQYLCRVAVEEIMARKKEIKEKGLSALEKSALTPTIISAIKTAAALILPYAPAPTDDERKQMSKAAILLGLFPDDIAENPDDFTAPPPATVDIEPETKE